MPVFKCFIDGETEPTDIEAETKASAAEKVIEEINAGEVVWDDDTKCVAVEDEDGDTAEFEVYASVEISYTSIEL